MYKIRRKTSNRINTKKGKDRQRQTEKRRGRGETERERETLKERVKNIMLKYNIETA